MFSPFSGRGSGLVWRIPLAGLLTLLAGALPGAVLAQDCSAHYPFDGSLADVVGGHDGTMITADGGSGAPEFVAGRTGQALVLGERAAMRAFLDVNPDVCPQLTISAWLRVDPEVSSTRMVVSTGNPQSPGFRVSSGSLTLNGPANGLTEASVFRPQGGWTLVAGVYDFGRGTYTLHWRSRSTPPRELNDRWRPPDEALWVGAMNDRLAHPAIGVVIDDLRITPRVLNTEQIAALHRGGGLPAGSMAASAPAADTPATPVWQGSACAAHRDCDAGSYCGMDQRCHPDLHAPMASEAGSGMTLEDMRERNSGVEVGAAVNERMQTNRPLELPAGTASGSGMTLEDMRERDSAGPDLGEAVNERIAAGRPPELEYDSDEAAAKAQREREARARENEQLPAPTIDAVMDLQTLSVRYTLESEGDEYYLVRYPLRGRFGAGDRIYTFDYADQVWPIPGGEDAAREGDSFSIPQGAGRFVFDDVAPFEVYGFVVVLMEANRNTIQEQTWAFGFGEFQNESGVTEVISSAFARAVPRDGSQPDYADTSCANIRRIFQTIESGIESHFGDYTDYRRGLPEAIRVALIEPLARNNRDRIVGSFWAFGMNTPGGSRGQACLENPDPTLFPPPGSPMLFDLETSRFTGEHRQ